MPALTGPTSFAVVFSGGSVLTSWDAASVPEGLSVLVEALDATGAPLVPQPTVTYAKGSATLVWASMPDGTAFSVRARFVGPWAGPISGVARTLGAVAAPALTWSGGKLHATWTALVVSGVTVTYEVALCDAAGTPVAKQPTPSWDTSTSVSYASAALESATTWTVAVRAVADGSVGPWSTSAPLTIDVTQPDSPLLQALLGRLKAAAGTTLALDSATLQLPEVTAQLQQLLALPNGALTVTAGADPLLGSDWAGVYVKGSATLPLGAATVALTFGVTEDGSAVTLSLAATGLGDHTVAELQTAGLLPATTTDVAVWGAGLSALPSVALTLETATSTLTVTSAATATPWTVPVGLVGVTIGTVQAAIVARINPATFAVDWSPEVQTTLAFGASIPIRLRLPSGFSGWAIRLDTTNGPAAVGTLSTLAPLFGGGNPGLPTDVAAMPGFEIDYLELGFAASAASRWDLSVGLAIRGESPPSWTPVGSALTLTELRAEVRMLIVSASAGTFTTTASGSLGATLGLGGGVTASATLQLPAGPDGYALEAAIKTENATLDALAPLLGGDASPLTGALARVGTVTAGAVGSVAVWFTTGTGATLNRISAGLALTSWTVPGLSWFQVSSLEATLDVQKPLDSARVIDGAIRGLLALGSVSVGFDATFAQGRAWTLALAGADTTLSGLADVSNILSADQISAAVPSGMTVDGDLTLGRLALAYNLADGFLSAASVGITSTSTWQIPIASLALTGFEVNLGYKKAKAADPIVVLGSVQGVLELAEAPFVLRGERATEADPWSFSAELEEGASLDLLAAFSGLGVTNLKLPSTSFGFPTALSLSLASVRFIPSTGKVSLSGAVDLTWSFQLAGATFGLSRVGGSLEVPGSDTPDAKTTGSVYGALTLAGAPAAGRVVFGSDPNAVVVSGAITSGGTSATAVLDSLLGGTPMSLVPVPSGFSAPDAMAEAWFELDLGNQTFLGGGAFTTGGAGGQGIYGAMGVYVLRQQAQGGSSGTGPNNAWGFAVAATLQNWTLADLAAPLAVVDTALGIQRIDAAIALSLLPVADTSALATAVPGLPAGLPLIAGLSFYGKLDFSGGLLPYVAALVSISGEVVVTGAIPADAGTSIFTASFGKVTLLSFLDFQNVVLTFAVASNPQGSNYTLTLTGDLNVSLGSTPVPAFHGDLVVSSTAANFKVQTANSVPNPLGMPGIRLDKLGFSVATTFSDKTPTNTTLAFFGQVGFGSLITLAADCVLVGGAAQIVRVRLVDPEGKPASLGIGALFAQVVGLTWPTGAYDVTLSNGLLWWVPGATAVTLDSQSYAPGFHAAADVTILFLPTVRLDVAVYTSADQGHAPGLVASASFASPINLGFLSFTGATNPAVGPGVAIDTTAQLPFTLSAGASLFNTPCAALAISVGTTQMTGTLSLAQEVPVFGKPSLSFTWSEADGFQVTSWPLPNLGLPKFNLDDLEIGSCGSTGISLPIDTKFNLTASLSIKLGSDGRPVLGVVLNGTFNLVSTATSASSDPLLTANIVQVPISIPLPTNGQFGFSDLSNAFVGAISGAASSIFDNLVRDPANLAKLLGIAGIKWGLQALVDWLVCDGWEEAAAQGFADAAAGAAVTEVLTPAGAIVVGGVAVGIVGGIVSVLTGGGGSSGGGGGGPPPPPPGTPTAPTLSFDGTNLAISWSSVDNASTYGIDLRDGRGNALPIASVSGTSTSWRVPAALLGQTISAAVVAFGGGTSKEGPKATLPLLAVPAPTLSFSSSPPTVTASWPPVPNATGYRVQWVDGANNPLGAAITTSTPSAAYTGPNASVPGTVGVIVSATGPNTASPPSATVTLAITQLPAPAAPTASMLGATLQLSWAPVPGASSYSVVLLNGSSAPISPAPTITIAGTTAAITGEALYTGLSVIAAITAQAANQLPATGPSTSYTLLALLTPAVTASVNGTVLTASWPAVPGATGYAAALLDANGAPLPVTLTVTATTASGDCSGLAAGQAFTLSVTASAPSATSLPGTLASTWAPLATPLAPAATVTGTDLSLAWGPLSGATGWDLTVTSDGVILVPSAPPSGDTPVVLVPVAAGVSTFFSSTAVTLVVSGTSFTAGRTIAVMVRGTTAGTIPVTGPWSSTTTLQWTLSLAQVAASLFTAGTAVGTATANLVAQFPSASPSDLAVALVVAGYVATDVLTALRAAIPGLTPAQATAAIEAVYDLGTLSTVAANAVATGDKAVAVEAMLLARFGKSVDPSTIAQATVIGGLAPTDALTALRDPSVFGTGLTPAQATAAITAVYSEDTVVARAKHDFAAKVPVTQEIAALRAAFEPQLNDSDLQQAMITAGYPASEVQAGFSGTH